MRIRRITLSNFQCFGETPTTLDLNELTVLIGSNGSGKTAVLEALCRMFGVSSQQRNLTRHDFHVAPGNTLETAGAGMMRVDIEFDLNVSGDSYSEREKAAAFGQMSITEPGGKPFVRAVLEATWSPGPSEEGVIESNLFWATTAETPVPDKNKVPMKALDRSQIVVHYVPASRDPDRQLRNVSGTLLHRVFRAISWSEKARGEISEAAGKANAALEGEIGLGLFGKKVEGTWRQLHPSEPFGLPRMKFLGSGIDEALRQASMMFSSGPDGLPTDLDRLSDGQRSLFYLTLIGAVFELECDVVDSAPLDGSPPAAGSAAAHISAEALGAPFLSIFAIEEPENHLSPHYLGRIVQTLGRISASPLAQVLATTHSPSIMGRVEPSDVRHLRLGPGGTSRASSLPLPSDDAEAAKFVREAVLGFPELYFADLVVLGEGDSEQIVIPKLLQAYGVDPDPSRVSVVPIGGRFVHHFWRLLGGLDIPTITLLDFDIGRHGGKWGRIKHVCGQLVANGADWATLSTGLAHADGSAEGPHDLSTLHVRTDDHFGPWIEKLEELGTYFSGPLDLDFAMLRRFGDAYRATASMDPSLPQADPERSEEMAKSVAAVLKKKGDPTYYQAADLELFPWYHELFLKSGKPSTHMQAIASITREKLASDMPAAYKRMCESAKATVGTA